MTIALARDIGRALNVRSETQVRALNNALNSFVRLTQVSGTIPMTGSIAASQVISGVFAVARIPDMTTDKIDGSGLANHVDDAAAATGGIAVGSLYRNGSIVMVRVA